MLGVATTVVITMGDVAGVGPEIIARAWPALVELCRPVVVGDEAWLRRALELFRSRATVKAVQRLDESEPTPTVLPCLQAGLDLNGVEPGRVNAKAGRAAYDFLCAAIDLAASGEADAVVTCPLHKEGLHAAGLSQPGHTEILAERTRTSRYAMMLFADGLGVVHVTLHTALRDVFAFISEDNILEKTRLIDGALRRLLGREPRVGVAALNPHASDGGLFGNEEARTIAPAVQRAVAEGIDASGPWPADTLFARARAGEFDGIVAMYHDQGHIPMKLLAGRRAVNVSLGLPIVRTSVAHGTAYDIAWRGVADPTSLIEATRVAVRLTRDVSGSSDGPGKEATA